MDISREGTYYLKLGLFKPGCTRDIDFLNLASENCIKAGKERNYKKTISLFLNLGNAYLNEEMYDKAEMILNNIIFELDPEQK